MATKKSTLTRYHEKRDFKKTAEPKGKVAAKEGFSYLIQKHAASRLHYDFRLELGGTLKSWAVTRGPSLDPADKRLAVEVEDHPVEYGSFEGTIPKGQYGGGTVMLWDVGSWEPIGDPEEGLRKGKLEFILHGKRLHGEWTLVRMKGREQDRGRNNWLLIKHKDKFAKAGDHDALLEKNDKSVVSRRSMEKIASANDNVWQSKAKAPSKKPAQKKSVKSKLPAFIPPELATLADAMPQGAGWVHEIKFDGYRTLAYINGGEVTMYTRNGLDWTAKFGKVPDALAQLAVENAIIDGELVTMDDHGVTSFKKLHGALKENQSNLQYYAFDLLYLNGQDMRKYPLLERKSALEKILKNPALKNRVFYSEHFSQEEDKALMGRVCDLGLEGLISKRADARYSSGRGKSWLKTKCSRRQEFVIGGFTEPTHKQRGVGALLLGYYKGSTFTYAGKVGTGFDNATSMALRKKLDGLRVQEMAFDSVTTDGRRGAQWVKPSLVCEVEFTEWTADGHLRHPSFQGLREDKPAKAIKKDKAIPVAKATRAAAKETKGTKSSKADAEVGGIRISNPGRVIYPGTDITKLQLAEYYLAVADAILPHVANRPLSMVRCPEGSGEPCFFQRHIAKGQSPYLHETGIAVKGRREEYMMIKDARGLISLAQWGVIELHPWGCKAGKPELPDRIIFDLDPDPAVPFAKVMEGAKDVRARMKEFGLESFVKTTGGKGLHVVVPLTPKYGWDTIKAFARAVAESMQRDDPTRYIATASKAARRGKIFVDYLRNDLTSTAVAPYSARAREGATVATPLGWSELTAKLKPAGFTIETIPARLRKKDPWADMPGVKQQISARILRALKIEL